MRALVLALLLVACGRKRDDGAHAVPEKEHAPVRKATCDGGLCAGECVDLSSDPQRCGACDHACPEGYGCVASMCAEPVDWSRAPGGKTPCPFGERYAVRCPKLTSVSSTWGTDTYTTDSSICTAALHAGKITVAGGDVAYEIRPGRSTYEGTDRNGYASMGWGPYACSFAFVSEGCAAGLARCGTTCANLELDAANCGSCGHDCGVGSSCRKGACRLGFDASHSTTATGIPCTGTRVFHCPPLPTPSGSLGTVWGTDLYTNDSAICVAAVHAGATTFAAGGTVTIELLPGASSYKGSTRRAVTTVPWLSWSCSYRFK